LALETEKVAVEYDGRWHRSPEQVVHDHERRGRLTAEGWVFVIVHAEQLATDYAGILERISVARRTQLAG
jgi:very-short-patch-repair endonuclease